MNGLVALVRLARPKQWVKNIFVFTVLIFSRHTEATGEKVAAITDLGAITDSLIAFACFCLASSAIYFFNDYRDVEEDRRHPVKRERPLAKGDL